MWRKHQYIIPLLLKTLHNVQKENTAPVFIKQLEPESKSTWLASSTSIAGVANRENITHAETYWVLKSDESKYLQRFYDAIHK